MEKLKGFGPKSQKCLNKIGIYTKQDLAKIGPVTAYMKLKQTRCGMKPSLNFLYAMVAALEDRHWTDIAKSEKTRLLLELEAYKELENDRQS